MFTFEQYYYITYIFKNNTYLALLQHISRFHVYRENLLFFRHKIIMATVMVAIICDVGLLPLNPITISFNFKNLRVYFI